MATGGSADKIIAMSILKDRLRASSTGRTLAPAGWRRTCVHTDGKEDLSEWGGLPHPASAGELQALLIQEGTGVPFLMYRDAASALAFLELQPAGGRATIGRRAGNDLALDWDPEVSRSHAEVELVGGDWTVVDDGLSRNGSYLNGSRVGGRRRLSDGDILKIGRTPLMVRIPAEGSSTATASAEGLAIVEHLTPTQRRVLVALCRPYRQGEEFSSPAPNQDIAAEVFLSVDAVKNHLRTLFQKFEISHLAQNQKRVRLVECAFQWGLVSERDL